MEQTETDCNAKYPPSADQNPETRLTMKEDTRRRSEAYERNKVRRAFSMSMAEKREMQKLESDARIDSVSRKLAVAIIELAPTCETFELVQAIPKAIVTALTACDITDNNRKFIQTLVLQLNYQIRKDKNKKREK